MKRFFRCCISSVLICCIILCGSVKYVAASENNEAGVFEEERTSLEENGIICYIDGIPIHYYDVDEYGIIKEGVLDGCPEEIENNKSSFKQGKAELLKSSGKKYLTINSPELKEGLRDVSDVNIYPYKGAAIRTKIYIGAQRVDETYYTVRTYMSASAGAKFASSIEINPAIPIILSTISYFIKYGEVISALVGFKAAARAELATRIRKYTNEGKKVCVIEGAGVVGVKEWTGSSCTVISRQASYGSDHATYEELVSINVSEE